MTWDEALAIAQEILRDYPAVHLREIAREFNDDADWHLLVNDALPGDAVWEQDKRTEWIGSREQWDEYKQPWHRPADS